MANFLMILGACTFSFGVVYLVLRLGCWVDGRKW